MIVLVIIIVIAVVGMGYQKFRGDQALTFTHIDVAGLTLDEIIAIGSKAAGSLAGRLVGIAPTARSINDGAEWHAKIQGSVMSFTAEPLPDGSGYRVGGAATKMRISQNNIGSNQGIWGFSKAVTNAIFRVLGIPHNSPALVRRRARVLRAIANAGKVLEPSPAETSAVSGTNGRTSW